jgi:hypothetical protein
MQVDKIANLSHGTHVVLGVGQFAAGRTGQTLTACTGEMAAGPEYSLRDSLEPFSEKSEGPRIEHG